ncbi:ESX-1 secretion-associated protein [Mycolicibacterium goodii]|uniref:ESX-1 secretion-associated protein n=1 Tax=Mycolicibacterium goodii TaxID=134601 RepID=UPI000C262CA9|nr:ESX-1 secretion-associated protein [Mycolicibacterium goodii]PJK19974.1 ESX-1 secretion-associated protein [Mycolicibacterium goodii]
MSSDLEKNLTVLTDHIRKLSTVQDKAVGEIDGANRSMAENGNNMWETHGVVSALTNMAVADAVEARKAAGGALRRVSVELAEKLRAAATNYDNTDSTEAGRIDTCGV